MQKKVNSNQLIEIFPAVTLTIFLIEFEGGSSFSARPETTCVLFNNSYNAHLRESPRRIIIRLVTTRIHYMLARNPFSMLQLMTSGAFADSRFYSSARSECDANRVKSLDCTRSENCMRSNTYRYLENGATRAGIAQKFSKIFPTTAQHSD